MKSIFSKKQIPLILLFFMLHFFSFAQNNPGGGGIGPNDPGGTSPGWVPIDGGLAFFLAVGVGYGTKKAYDYRSKKQKNLISQLD